MSSFYCHNDALIQMNKEIGQGLEIVYFCRIECSVLSISFKLRGRKVAAIKKLFNRHLSDKPLLFYPMLECYNDKRLSMTLSSILKKEKKQLIFRQLKSL